jgi:hypothetical protein
MIIIITYLYINDVIYFSKYYIDLILEISEVKICDYYVSIIWK